VPWACEHSNESSGSLKYGKFTDYISDYTLASKKILYSTEFVYFELYKLCIESVALHAIHTKSVQAYWQISPVSSSV
jgi:hypothetical protein